MIRFARLLVMLSLLVLAAAYTAAAQESRTVAAEGVAMVQQGALDIARDAAVEDAQKRAVEQAIGILIDSQTQVENYQVISDKILSQTKGYIKRYSIAGEVNEGSLLRVRINAEVALGKLVTTSPPSASSSARCTSPDHDHDRGAEHRARALRLVVGRPWTADGPERGGKHHHRQIHRKGL